MRIETEVTEYKEIIQIDPFYDGREFGSIITVAIYSDTKNRNKWLPATVEWKSIGPIQSYALAKIFAEGLSTATRLAEGLNRKYRI